jgi:hypothetical protein
MNPEKMPDKLIHNTSHKFSTDKEESFNEANDLSPESSLRLFEKDSNSDPFHNKLSQTPMK